MELNTKTHQIMRIMVYVTVLPIPIDVILTERLCNDEGGEGCFASLAPFLPLLCRQTDVQRLSPNYFTVHFSRSGLEIGKNKNVEGRGENQGGREGGGQFNSTPI